MCSSRRVETSSNSDGLAASAGVAAAVLRRQLARGEPACLRMRGRSMRPLLDDGAQVQLRSVSAGENLAGRIVAVDAGPFVVVHRVIRDRGAWIETRGIAREDSDQPWPRAAVIGVARARWLRPLAVSLDAAMRVRRAVIGRLR